MFVTGQSGVRGERAADGGDLLCVPGADVPAAVLLVRSHHGPRPRRHAGRHPLVVPPRQPRTLAAAARVVHQDCSGLSQTCQREDSIKY